MQPGALTVAFSHVRLPTPVHRSRGTEEILAEHEPIVAAVLARDAGGAASAMRDHLLHTAELLARQIDPRADLAGWRERVAAVLGTS